MFDSIHEFLYSIRPVIALITVPVGSFFAWRIWTLVTAPTPAAAPGTARMPRKAPPKPVTPQRPGGVQQNLLGKPGAPSTESGQANRLVKSQEPTIRIGSEDKRPDTKIPHGTTELLGKGKSTDEDEVGAMFAGLDDTLKPAGPPPPVLDPMSRASRLEELGFHHPIASDLIGAHPEPPKGSLSTPVTATKAPELDDILARLDKVLGENDEGGSATPAAKAPTPSLPPPPPPTAIIPAPAKPPTAAIPPAPPKAPLWARPDVTDEEMDGDKGDDSEPGQQLGLFDKDDGKKPANGNDPA